MKIIVKNKKLFIGFFTVLCIFLALTSFNRINPTLFERSFGFIITPIQNIITSSNNWIGKKISVLSNISELEAENEELKLELELKNQEINTARKRKRKVI